MISSNKIIHIIIYTLDIIYTLYIQILFYQLYILFIYNLFRYHDYDKNGLIILYNSIILYNNTICNKNVPFSISIIFMEYNRTKLFKLL
jgi:hypothetical protein